jgi:hypothetical protein
MRFGSLDFVITVEEDMERAPVAVPPSPAMGLDMVVETLEGLWLRLSKSRALEHGQLDSSIHRSSEHQQVT